MMPSLTHDPFENTIRILIATDNHVGYNERDPIRGEDSSRSFDEVLQIAKDRDVDLVLLGGDLFHDNKPSRKAMYDVMKSLRTHCMGDKPCELEMVSEANDFSTGSFNHANYQDPNINVSIPVFSIHGNHDDPAGDGHLCALDILQIAGLINYFGRTPESDNISIKPVLLRKGDTRLALFGLSNVRDERLYRTFRDGKVKFFRPRDARDEYFNLIAVHQNHHAHTETSYLPENFLPSFLDFVLWGHEHECLINPRINPEMGFSITQPGSSVATALCQGESVAKHIAILSVTGREFKSESIRLKSVRPFLMKEIVLSEEKGLAAVAKKRENRAEVTRYLTSTVEKMIQQAREDWMELQESIEDPLEVPLPLIRLRVEYSAPEPGAFEVENPQRFSNRFIGKVANVHDVVQFHRKKKGTTRAKNVNGAKSDGSAMANITVDNIKVEKLVREFLSQQSLIVLPQNSFGDAVRQFVDKDNKFAVDDFVNDSLGNQLKYLMESGDVDDDDIQTAMDETRTKLENMFASGQIKRKRLTKTKPKPDNWDSDMDGDWEDQPAAIIASENEHDNEDEDAESTIDSTTTSARGRGAKRGRDGTTRGAAKPAAAPRKSRTTKTVIDDDDDDDDIIMLDEEDEEVIKPSPKPRAPKKASTKPVPKPRAAKKVEPKQTSLFFSQSSQGSKLSSTQSTFGSSGLRRGASRSAAPASVVEDIDDDSDAFEPA